MNTKDIKITEKQVSIATPEELQRVIGNWIDKYKEGEKRLNIPVTIDNEIDAYEFYKLSILSCVKIIITYSNGGKVTLYSVVQNYPEDETLLDHVFIDDIYNGLVDISLAHIKLRQ